MTDAQYIFDLAARQYNETADVIEKHFETVADQIRDWIPRKASFTAPPPPPPTRSLPVSYVTGLQSWALRHKALSASILAFFGTGAVYMFFQRRSFRQRRRAKRTIHGARTEVVVLAGSAMSPLTTALALDLERRGYIVYVVTNTPEEARHVKSHSRMDILPLNLDLINPEDASEEIGRIHRLLARHHCNLEGEHAYRLTLVGLILVPDTQSRTGSIADIGPEVWSDSLNAKVLNTVVTTQHLMPLITDFQSRVLLLMPSVVPSLNPPLHGIESTVSGALRGFSESLSAELHSLDISFSHIKLGHLELSPGQAKSGANKNRVKGTPLRRLHDTVFDVLQSSRPWRTYHVGKGSLTYDLIGTVLPRGVVGWMLRLPRARVPQTMERRTLGLTDSSSEGSAQWEKVDEPERISGQA